MSVAGELSSLLESVNAEDTEGFLDSFTDDAVVDDEGHRYQGLLQIAEWNTREVIGAHARVHPLRTSSCAGAGGPHAQALVEVHVDGAVERCVVTARWCRDRIEHLSVRSATSA